MIAFAATEGEIANIEAQLTTGNYRVALTKLESIPAQSRNSGWHLLASRAYDGLNEPAKAVEEAQTAIGAAPRSEAAHLQLAQIFLSRNTPLPAYEILSAATEYMRRNPKDFRGYYYLAAAREKLQMDAEGTEKLIRRSIEYNSRFAASYALLGKVLMGSGRLEAAAGALEEAVRLRADYTPAHYYRPTSTGN